jgi:hypothetical protein
MNNETQQFIDRIAQLQDDVNVLKRLESQRKGSGQIVAYSSDALTPSISSTTTWNKLMNTGLTVTTIVGRRYRFVYYARALTPNDGVTVSSLGVGIFQLSDLPYVGSVPTILGDDYFRSSGPYDSVYFSRIRNGDGISRNYIPGGILRNGVAMTSYSTEFYIEDMGKIA